jgi:hypothetical protein
MKEVILTHEIRGMASSVLALSLMIFLAVHFLGTSISITCCVGRWCDWNKRLLPLFVVYMMLAPAQLVFSHGL